MTPQNVGHYMRFRDQMKVAADGRKRLQIIGKRGLDREPADSYSHVASGWFCKKDIEPCKKFGKIRMKSTTYLGNGVTVAQQTLTLFV
jgi:hypothetical protein